MLQPCFIIFSKGLILHRLLKWQIAITQDDNAQDDNTQDNIRQVDNTQVDNTKDDITQDYITQVVIMIGL